MKLRFACCLFLLCLFALTAQAKPKLAEPPPATVLQSAWVVQPLGSLGGSKHPEPRNIVDGAAVTYTQDFGGSVGIGVAFGPLGVLANIKNIQRNTEREVAALRGKFAVDPAVQLAEVLAARAGVTESSAAPLALLPSLYVTRNKAGQLMFRCVLGARSGEWESRYVVALPLRMSLDTAAAGLDEAAQSALRDSVRDGFAEALSLLERDARGELNAIVERKLNIEAFSPRFDFFLPHNVASEADGRMVIRGWKVSAQDQLWGGGGVLSVAVPEVREKGGRASAAAGSD